MSALSRSRRRNSCWRWGNRRRGSSCRGRGWCGCHGRGCSGSRPGACCFGGRFLRLGSRAAADCRGGFLVRLAFNFCANFYGDVFRNGTRVSLLFRDAIARQKVDDGLGFYFQFAGQLINTDLICFAQDLASSGCSESPWADSETSSAAVACFEFSECSLVESVDSALASSAVFGSFFRHRLTLASGSVSASTDASEVPWEASS